MLFELNAPYWEADGKKPVMWTDGYAGRVMVIQGNDGNYTGIRTWTTGLQARALDKMSYADGIATVQATLEAIRPAMRGNLKAIRAWSWQRQVESGGTYATWSAGQIRDYANTMSNPAGRVFFAGEHTAKLERGMEGACESGERAAFEIAEMLEG